MSTTIPPSQLLPPAGDPATQLAALRDGCALTDLSWKGRIELLGADRQRLLHGLVTCDVKGLTPGTGTYGFFTSPQGRILADGVVLALEDRLWLEVPPGQDEDLRGHIQKYILADRVEVLPLEDMLPITLAGPGAAERLSACAPLPEAPWEHKRVKVHGTEVVLMRREGLGAPAFTLWVSASIAPMLIEDLLAEGSVQPAGFEALEILRVEQGIPRYGIDFGADNFPQETGIDAAVSYTKGCYLGQEVVARIHYRGGVQKALRGLRFATAPQPGAKLSLEGRDVGTVGSVVDSAGGPRGLAILHRRGFEPGTVLEIEGGGSAEVLALP